MGISLNCRNRGFSKYNNCSQESPFLRAAAFRLFGEMAARVGHVEQVGEYFISDFGDDSFIIEDSVDWGFSLVVVW